MFQCRERQRGCANTNIGWQTLCGSRQTWDLLPPATKVEIQNGDDDTNTKKSPTQRHRNGQYWAPLRTTWAASKNQDQDLEFICCIFHIIVVNTTFSGWTYICFIIQHTCKSSFHVACNHCSPICFLDHIRDTVTRQTPNPSKIMNFKNTHFL